MISARRSISSIETSATARCKSSSVCRHGQWKGVGWAESVVVDLNDLEIRSRIPFGNIDHVARAVCDGAEGWGLFEHASIGAHAPTGFTDLMSVAP